MSRRSNQSQRVLSHHSASPRVAGENAAAGGAANWLSFAAAPTFAMMALLTGTTSSADMICSAAQDTAPLNGMVAMYVLMSLFHSTPWLKLVSGGGSRVRPE